MVQLTLNGHTLPAELVDAINGDWIKNVDKDAVAKELGVSCGYLHFFRADYISGLMAKDWLELPEPYRGSTDAQVPPGDIEPAMSVVIGEVESDSPLAVDFRTSPPSVVAYPWPKWVTVASDISELLDKLDPSGKLRAQSSGGGD